MDDEDLHYAGATPAPEQESLTEELRGIADDARALARAEFAYQKSRATYAGKQALVAAAFTGAALVFLFFAVEALVFGGILVLASRLSPLGATAAVAGALVAAALFCIMFAMLRWRRMKAKIVEQDD